MSITPPKPADISVLTKLAEDEPKGELLSGVTFQFFSTPCAFVFPNGRRIVCIDGTYTTEDEYEIAELSKAVDGLHVNKLS